jgi:DNA-binding HxlR family transcriptional regulator
VKAAGLVTVVHFAAHRAASRTGRPIMALLDLLGRRWALRVIWELGDDPLSFRELQAACDGVSSSVLNDRLSELRDAGAIERDAGRGFRLTQEGASCSRSTARSTRGPSGGPAARARDLSL